MATSINLSVLNFKQLRAKPPADFDAIRFDPNNDCNIHCVYCPMDRSKEIIPFDEFEKFLYENTRSVGVFQFGCRMEPTLDPRLCELMLLVAQSPGKPTRRFRLQTNGTLLHRHDFGKMREAGVNFLTVSIDAADPIVFKRLRGGASLAKIYRNIVSFAKACPAATLAFITTVTSANIGLMDGLIESGLQAGVTVFNLRQVGYDPNNTVVDHSLMAELVVSGAEFSEMTERVRTKYGRLASFLFQDTPALREAASTARAASLLQGNWAMLTTPNT